MLIGISTKRPSSFTTFRELSLWSKIKSELDNQTFDTKNVNTHQAESLHKYFENRVKSLNDASAPGEIMNAMGPYLSFNRMKNEEGTLLNFLGGSLLVLIR